MGSKKTVDSEIDPNPVCRRIVDRSVRRYAPALSAWVSASAGVHRLVLYHELLALLSQGFRPHSDQRLRSFHIVADVSARLWNSGRPAKIFDNASDRLDADLIPAGSLRGPARQKWSWKTHPASTAQPSEVDIISWSRS